MQYFLLGMWCKSTKIFINHVKNQNQSRKLHVETTMMNIHTNHQTSCELKRNDINQIPL